MSDAAYDLEAIQKPEIHNPNALLSVSSTGVRIRIATFEVTYRRIFYNPTRITKSSSARSLIPKIEFSDRILKIIDRTCQRKNCVDPKQWRVRPKKSSIAKPFEANNLL
jgi:hypothetical protein